jgi:hypothetical protein
MSDAGTNGDSVRFFIPARQMSNGELVFDWDEKIDWTQDADDLDTLNVGWFWVEVKSVLVPNASVSISGDEPEYDPRTCSIEGYPKDWVRVTLAVSPSAKEIYALDGDREEGDGDTPYIGYERILNRLQSNAESEASQ